VQPLNPSFDAPRRDPAPSRVAYRMHRLWLTPLFRTLLKRGLPVALVAGFGAWVIADSGRRETLQLEYARLVRSIEERPEFMVELVAIDGATPALQDAIRKSIPVSLPVSSFELDLGWMHDQIMKLDAVQAVNIRVRKGGILQFDVTERQPVLVWRTERGIEMLDATGHPVGPVSARLERPDLPLVTGVGADAAVPEALAIFAAAGPLLPRVRGLVRLGERRWDIVLDQGQRLMLPEANPVNALEQILALDQATDLLSREVSVVDMRNDRHPTLRLSAPEPETDSQPAAETGAPSND
jgi:cell division protein FtsQ